MGRHCRQQKTQLAKAITSLLSELNAMARSRKDDNKSVFQSLTLSISLRTLILTSVFSTSSLNGNERSIFPVKLLESFYSIEVTGIQLVKKLFKGQCQYYGQQKGWREGLVDFFFFLTFSVFDHVLNQLLYIFKVLIHLHLLVRLNIYDLRDFGIQLKIQGRKRLVILADFFAFWLE